MAKDLPHGAKILRIIATSDLHMHLSDFDYEKGRGGADASFARLAPLIRKLRDETDLSLFFDNGDLIQGTAMSPIALGLPGPHPMLAALGAVGLDAATLGNHDLDFGMEVVGRLLNEAPCPVVTSNLAWRTSGEPVALPSALLNRSVTDASGAEHPISIGVFGILPPVSPGWAGQDVSVLVEGHDAIDAAKRETQRLKDQGADLVIGLCHSGISATASPRAENVLLQIAETAGADALIGGHTHISFPGPTGVGAAPRCDHKRGTIAGIPAVAPLPFAREVGVIDLTLERHGASWVCVDHKVTRVAPKDADQCDPEIVEIAKPAHVATLDRAQAIVGETPVCLNSFFDLVGPSHSIDAMLQAMRRGAQGLLEGHPLADLPLITMVSPTKAGGHNGPENYIKIPKGPVTLGQVNSIYPFNNSLCIAETTGAGLKSLLAESASAFRQVARGAEDACLIDDTRPSYAFDIFDGIEVVYDLSQPVRIAGTPNPARVADVTRNGAPLEESDRFLLAMHDHRASHGGAFTLLDLPQGPEISTLLEDAFADGLQFGANPSVQWSFAHLPQTTTLFRTSPAASTEARVPKDLRVDALGIDGEGFRVYRLYL